MIITTTNQLDGLAITQYIGPVTGEVVMGTNAIKDLFASISDIFGGRSNSYENSLAKSIDNAVLELQERATQMGADAVVGMQHSISSIGEGMMMVVVMGTAVKTQKA